MTIFRFPVWWLAVYVGVQSLSPLAPTFAELQKSMHARLRPEKESSHADEVFS
jgi:hypothetical protein